MYVIERCLYKFFYIISDYSINASSTVFLYENN